YCRAVLDQAGGAGDGRADDAGLVGAGVDDGFGGEVDRPVGDLSAVEDHPGGAVEVADFQLKTVQVDHREVVGLERVDLDVLIKRVTCRDGEDVGLRGGVEVARHVVGGDEEAGAVVAEEVGG